MSKVLKRLQWWAVLGALFFMIIQVICDLQLPNLTADIINNGVAKGDTNYIWNVGVKMLILALISLLAAVGNVYFASTQAQRLGSELRKELYRHVIKFDFFDLEKFGSSSLTTRTTNDVIQIQNVVVMMLRMMIQAPIMLLGAGFMAYITEKKLTYVFLISIPLLILAMAIVMGFAVPLFKKLQKQIDKLNLVFREGLTGVRVIRAFRQDQMEQDRFDEANKDYTQTGMRVFSIVSLMFPILTLILNGTSIAIVWGGGRLIRDMSMQVGDLVSFMTYASMVLFSFMMLSMIFVFIPRAQAASVRINEVLDTKNVVKDPTSPETVDTNVETTLDYDNVEFTYGNAQRPALTDVNIHMKAGQTLAIIGGTGSSKSTLINLIPRFFDVTKGSVKINGHDIRNLTQHDLHAQISFVQQKAVLFKGTVRSNLQFGKEDATDEEMWRALEIAQARDFIEESPEGLDTVVEEGGNNFSGGQKQRLAIARALIKPALIYVFDDSFSALDFKTDAKLRAALRKDPVIQKAIVVIVAQRVSTVTAADEIVVLDEGKVVEQGTHDELKINNGIYQEIVASQMKGDEV